MTKKKPIVVIINGENAYHAMFEKLGFDVVAQQGTRAIPCDLVCFTGGADVSPFLYGDQNLSSHTHEARDAFENTLYKIYKGTPMVGICRGGQFLNVMNGGKMFQDVNNHLGNHLATHIDGTEWEVTSTHHQMMRPTTEGKVLVTAALSTKRLYWDKAVGGVVARNEVGEHIDTEVVLYGKELCFQPHPEFGVKSCLDLFKKCLKEII